MRMQYGILNEFYGFLGRFGDVTGKQGLAIAKTARAIYPHIETFEEMKMRLFKKYGDKDENGKLVVKKGTEKFDQFNRELMELLTENVDIEIYKVPKEDFDIDALYTGTARAKDYELFELMMVEENAKENNMDSGKPED